MSKTFKTACPDCKNEVWFFSCSCGSKIFFENLGYPWEKHTCKKFFLRTQIELIQQVDRLTTEEIYSIITLREKRTGFETDSAILEIIEEIIGPRKYEFKYTQVVPQHEETDIGGKVMQINNSINLLRKFGYEKSEMALKLLGEIAKNDWVQLSVRTNVNRKNECYQYDVLLKKEDWKENKISTNDIIAGILKPMSHPKGVFWYLKYYKIL